jgi:hypothetical protein
MHRPAFSPTKLRIHYNKTWAQFMRLVKNPHLVRPEAAPEHLAAMLQPQKLKIPKFKGNVLHTLKEIVNIFLAEWAKAPGPIALAIRTTRASLAKRCGNLDPKTSYRHVLCLIEHGYLRAKQHVHGGVQLLLNPDLIVFDAAPAVLAAAAPMPAVLPVVTPEQGLASLFDAAAQLMAEKSTSFFGKNSRRRS